MRLLVSEGRPTEPSKETTIALERLAQRGMPVGRLPTRTCKRYEDGTHPNHIEHGHDRICDSPLPFAVRANRIFDINEG